ncbi:TrkA domain protein [hydrothermal vent metagenome]|uniref:TrkA domain protein n=1 Tax=hydrothermal vent metagenome TaxID=652676 RepID=A0A1W1CXZ9_9ZZZZ
MKNILILADGHIANYFIAWVSKNRVAQNQYYVTGNQMTQFSDKLGKNVTFINADPTSFSKLSRIMAETKFSNIFIVMEEREDAYYVLKNISLINTKIRVVLLNQWEDNEIGKDQENITIIHTASLLSAHLYDQLPNVPLVAQNIGLRQGEIMEVHVPFGSSYAYRHIGSILQRKWKIAALYRDEKQILPTNATMIKPNDTLLILGKPLVLDGVYRSINKRIGLFPEPFGKDIYLLLDFRYDKEEAFRYLKEALYLLEKLEEKSLFVRIIYPDDFHILERLKHYESENVTICVHYQNEDVRQLIEYDIHKYNIGLVMNSIPAFEAENLKGTLYELKKLVYLFGTKTLMEIQTSVILMDEKEKMESISSTAFDITETLGLALMLADFDPEGDFEHKATTIEHYETLTHIFNMEITIEQKIANPIRELSKMDNILQIAPFEERLNSMGIRKFISSKIQDFILTIDKHSKLLIPFAITDS